MHNVLVWSHVGLMMAAFGASPMGRLALRYLLSRQTDRLSAQALARGFSRIFLIGGGCVTVGVCVGVAMARGAGLAETWVWLSVVLITIAGLCNVAIEDRWLRNFAAAQGDAHLLVMRETVPFVAAMVSPMIWLTILWLMIVKPV